MNLTDLSETIAKFEIDTPDNECDLWDYNFYASLNGDHEYMQSFSKIELCILRENCKNIIQLTDKLEVN